MHGRVGVGNWIVWQDQALWALFCIVIFKTRAMTNPLKGFKQRSAMFRFLFSNQESDDSEHFETFMLPGDILLMEQ